MAKPDRTGAFVWDNPDEFEIISAEEYERRTKGWVASLSRDTGEMLKHAKSLDDQA